MNIEDAEQLKPGTLMMYHNSILNVSFFIVILAVNTLDKKAKLKLNANKIYETYWIRDDGDPSRYQGYVNCVPNELYSPNFQLL